VCSTREQVEPTSGLWGFGLGGCDRPLFHRLGHRICPRYDLYQLLLGRHPLKTSRLLKDNETHELGLAILRALKK
jgi:hypothetical protein